MIPAKLIGAVALGAIATLAFQPYRAGVTLAQDRPSTPSAAPPAAAAPAIPALPAILAAQPDAAQWFYSGRIACETTTGQRGTCPVWQNCGMSYFGRRECASYSGALNE